MKIYEVLIEYTSSSLDRPFSYAYSGEKSIALLCRVLVPFRNASVCGIVVNIRQTEESPQEYERATGFQLKEIRDVIDDAPLLNERLNCLAKEVAEYYFAPLISVYFAMLPPSLKPALSARKQPKIAYESFVKPVLGANLDGLTTRQAEVLFHLMQEGPQRKSSLSPSIVQALLAKAKIVAYTQEKDRFALQHAEKKQDLKLNEEQEAALQAILSERDAVFLLEGVTGSGKTEVYLQAAKRIIAEGKKVLMLVPEISLTYAMVRRFHERFERIAILHSGLTSAQRYDQYRSIRNGSVDIVIGARSAVFAPLSDIGLIIVDEEHSDTYKQEDQLPYYNAVEVAKLRCRQERCRLVLGSATPSLESKSRALKGVYRQLMLSHRASDLPLPEVKIVNMCRTENIDASSVLISKPLRLAIDERLSRKEQVILLVNRRGHSPYVSCRACGHVLKCPECEVALTYHHDSGHLVCHHCGFEAHMVENCPKCGSDKVLKSGFGTEKIELAVKELFPEARVFRVDSDVAKKRNAVGDILTRFERREADILIGTQIVAKGHDFPDVTLVGVVLADVGLAIPSFRAGERTFDLLTQAIGRSGRSRKGEALIQTYLPEHYIIRTAASQDYLKFYATEIHYRKLMQNPPYTFLTMLIVSGEKEGDVIDATGEVCKYLRMHLEKEKGASLIGPSDMFIKKFQNRYRRKILLKYKDFSTIRPLLDDLRIFFLKKGSLTLQIDVDPYEDY